MTVLRIIRLDNANKNMFKLFSPSELLKPTPCILLWLVAYYYHALFDYAIWISFIVLGIWIGEAWQKSRQKLLINMTTQVLLEGDKDLQKDFYEMRKFILLKICIRFIGLLILFAINIYWAAYILVPIPI